MMWTYLFFEHANVVMGESKEIEVAEVRTFINKLNDLSPVTRERYIERLNTLEKGLEKDIYEVIKGAKASIAWIRKNYKSDITQKTLFSLVLSLYRYLPGLKEKFASSHAAWLEAFQTVDKAIEERYNQNEPTQKQREGYVSFDAIVKKRDALAKGSIERLLLGMYTHIRPMRADYNQVRLYKSAVPAKHEPNYITLKRNGCHMHLEEYKTAKTYGPYELDLPAELCSELHASLDKWPRQYLFAMKNDLPFAKSNSYIRWANKTLQTLFAPQTTTLTIIRHAYINSLDMNKLTIAERMEEARLMGHSKNVQEIYRLQME